MTGKGAGDVPDRVDGYVTDIAYPALFHRETSPVWLALAVAAIGQQAPALDRPFRYLDLGCGPGLNTALLAAACPQGRFVGVDFNPAHIADARARTEGLANCSFREAHFDTLRADPDAFDAPFDFIVLHGVYSWVSPDLRADLHALVARWLAPGGLLYLHYTSHPGQSAFAGAQAMLRRAAVGADSANALRQGLALLKALEAGGAGYFQANPAIARLLAGDEASAAYLAHDLLGRHWTALHCGDVIADLEATGCAFVGSATLLDNVDALSVPAATRATIGAIRDLKARETARDLARNQSVRRDIYRKGLSGLPPERWLAQLNAFRFIALPGLATDGDLVLRTVIGPVSLDAAVADAIRRRLRQGPVRLSELAAEAQLPRPLALQAVLMLVQAGEAHPQAPGTGTPGRTRMEGWVADSAIGSALPV